MTAGIELFRASLGSRRAFRMTPRGGHAERRSAITIGARRRCVLPMTAAVWEVAAANLPAGWEGEGGDLVCGARGRGTYDLTLVDVSGSGRAASRRASVVQEAVEDLLGAVPRSFFLPLLNARLGDGSWHESFATAVHVHLDDASGAFEIRSAGHPAALVCTADGGWRMVEGAAGLALGIVDGLGSTDFVAVRGSLEAGDSLVLYSDGVVERSDMDLLDGVAGLAAQLHDCSGRSVRGVVKELVAASREGDDRSVVVIRRAG